jgi:hypothetical protein
MSTFALLVGRQADTSISLLERPRPVGFVLVGIIASRWRDQLRTFLAEVIETTPERNEGRALVFARQVFQHGIADHERIAVAVSAPYFHVFDDPMELQGHYQLLPCGCHTPLARHRGLPQPTPVYRP